MSLCKWNKLNVALNLFRLTPAGGLTAARIDQLFRETIRDTFSAWSNLQVTVVRDPNLAGDIIPYWTESNQTGMWRPCDQQPVTGYFPLPAIQNAPDIGERERLCMWWASHEIGHALGLDHAPAGTGGFMDVSKGYSAYYDPVARFGDWERKETQKRYGARIPVGFYIAHSSEMKPTSVPKTYTEIPSNIANIKWVKGAPTGKGHFWTMYKGPDDIDHRLAMCWSTPKGLVIPGEGEVDGWRISHHSKVFRPALP